MAINMIEILSLSKMVRVPYRCACAANCRRPQQRKTMATTATQSTPPRKLLGAFLWLAQAALALVLISGAYMKLGMPLEQAIKEVPWVGELPGLAKFTGLVDLLGGLGILLPALLRIQPRLSVLAAVGIIALQLLAMGFHLMRGEAMVLPFNVVLLALAVFVLWGRTRAVPFASTTR
jgi:DoxX-like family